MPKTPLIERMEKKGAPKRVEDLREENETLRKLLLAHIPKHAKGTRFEGQVITGSAAIIQTREILTVCPDLLTELEE